jgi:hypothetical protein
MENSKGTRPYLPDRPTPQIRNSKREIRNSDTVHPRTRARGGLSSFGFWISLFVLLFAVGCGAPGEPVPPSPPVPVAVADLAAQQSGDGVELLFTLPAKSVSGDKLTSTPSVEVLRGALKPDGAPDSKSFRVVDTIPGSVIENYRVAGRIRFTDPIPPAQTKAHPGASVAYLIRTRVSSKRASADSNLVTARVFPVAEIVSPVELHLTESAVELSWPAPTKTSAGDPLPPVGGYRIYRGEIPSGAPAPTVKDLSLTKWTSRLGLLASSGTNNYRDTQFEFGKTYVYVVRTLITQEGIEIESGDSDPATIAAVDTFPPSAPQGLVAAVLPGAVAGASVVDLSWSINVETDLAGYYVYRSEQEGTRGRLVTPDLLLTPAVRDNSVEPGHRYWYTVTAVDRAGNESAPSTPAVVDLTQPPS